MLFQAFIHLLPQNRQLSPETKKDVEKMLLMGANSQLIKNDLAANKKKILLNKDLANIKAQAKEAEKTPDDLKSFCEILRTAHGEE